MLEKGSMIQVKKILGVILGIGGLGILMNWPFVEDYMTILAVAMLASAYFGIISGRQL